MAGPPMARRRILTTTALSASLLVTVAACGGNSNNTASGGSSSGGSSASTPAGTIGVILPDTVSSPRWESQDRPALEAAFKKAGVKYNIQNAQGDAQKMQTIAQQMETSGVTVLDKNTNYTKVAEQAVPKWDPTQAATIFQQMYTQTGGKIDGVLAANDTLANAAITTLKGNQRKLPVTGQDASVQGLQNILSGDQCMTVYKPAQQEAGKLAGAAVALLKGSKVETNGTSQDTEGNRTVASVLLDPISITKDNVKRVIDDGSQKASDVCTGNYASLCQQAGIS